VPLSDRERRLELVQALVVAPFISADEALVRCRQGADEIEALTRENAALRRERADLQERLRVAVESRRSFEARL
jgi:cell division protein FtsB